MMNWKFIAGAFLIWGLTGCGQKDNNNDGKEETSVETILPTEETEVRTKTLRTVDFEHELVSNGRISAQQIAELQFVSTSAGNVPVKIFVKNGDRITAGTAIAMLDTFQLSNGYLQAEDNLQKAYLELQDVLIGQGYSLADSASIPEDIFKLANIRSGYNNARIQYDLAKYNLDNAILRTPIAGTVANLFSKPYCVIDASEPFCTIISEGQPEVDFRILENEMPLIKTGDKVKVQSYASPDIESTGSIASINPSVDKDGTIRVKAYVQPHAKIFNGMNVRISVFRSLGKQWVVPKTAVVLRTGKQVVFAYKDGKAAWNYVDTGLENATYYTITSKSLQEGDEIIISGNEHLADGTNVKRMED
ncbi:MAG: efflux RND transporter periplasmic adaptor subunit [Tannerella sp.]|jgi:RND family efflux transporter MFP subunit|nr:efflux RND transporter periplasmic adaptor subunit [Tannerella sp.]